MKNLKLPCVARPSTDFVELSTESGASGAYAWIDLRQGITRNCAIKINIEGAKAIIADLQARFGLEDAEHERVSALREQSFDAGYRLGKRHAPAAPVAPTPAPAMDLHAAIWASHADKARVFMAGFDAGYKLIAGEG